MSLTLESSPKKQLVICANGILDITPTFISLPPNAGTGQIISVFSTGFWLITSYPSWITLSQTSGGAGSFNIIVSWNKALDSDIVPRTGNIVFQGFETVIANISQAISPKARGLFFDGVNDYAQFTSNENFNFEHTDSFSVSTWLKTGNSLVGTGGANAIVDKINIAPNASGWAFQYLSTGELYLLLFKAFPPIEQAELYLSNYFLNTNTFYHLCFAYSNHTISFYVNGILLPSGSVLGNVNLSIKSETPLLVGGKRNNSRSTNYDVKIFNKALNQFEVTDLYDFKTPETALPNLVFEAPFDTLYKPASQVFTPELVISNDGLLLGYPTGAKGIVDYLENDLQLVP
jgi:hypothetical protein